MNYSTKNNTNMKELMKRILMWSIAFIAILSIMIMAGEPDQPISTEEFVIPKFIALIAFVGCLLFGKYAQSKGWFPEGEKPFNED